MNLKHYIGKSAKKIILEWFYMDEKPISIIRLYVQIDDVFLNITCCEENVNIKEQEEPVRIDIENFSYIPITKEIDWLSQHEITSIKFLVDEYRIKRGVLFVFNNDQNFTFYNPGYELEDEDIFELNVDIKSLPYDLIDVWNQNWIYTIDKNKITDITTIKNIRSLNVILKKELKSRKGSSNRIVCYFDLFTFNYTKLCVISKFGDEGYYIEKKHNRAFWKKHNWEFEMKGNWLVYYWERNTKHNLVSFNSEIEACEYFYKLVQNIQ